MWRPRWSSSAPCPIRPSLSQASLEAVRPRHLRLQRAVAGHPACSRIVVHLASPRSQQRAVARHRPVPSAVAATTSRAGQAVIHFPELSSQRSPLRSGRWQHCVAARQRCCWWR